jgi:hypothetical protein
MLEQLRKVVPTGAERQDAQETPLLRVQRAPVGAAGLFLCPRKVWRSLTSWRRLENWRWSGWTSGVRSGTPNDLGQGSGQPLRDDRKAPLPSEWSVGEPSPGMVHNCPPVRIHITY